MILILVMYIIYPAPASAPFVWSLAFESWAHSCRCGDMEAVTSIVRPKQRFIPSFEPFDDPGCRFCQNKMSKRHIKYR